MFVFVFCFFQRDSTFSFLRYRLVGEPTSQCILKGDDVYWNKIPHCDSKQILNVLCTSLSRSYYRISGSLGNGRWTLSSRHLMQINVSL